MGAGRYVLRTFVLAVSVSLVMGMGALATGALAQEAAKDASKDLPPASTPVVPADEPSLFAFGDKNPDCAEWGDSCQVCQRGADGAVNCSTSGIACTPTKLICKRPVAMTKPPIEPAPLPSPPAAPAKPAAAPNPAAPEPLFPNATNPY